MEFVSGASGKINPSFDASCLFGSLSVVTAGSNFTSAPETVLVTLAPVMVIAFPMSPITKILDPVGLAARFRPGTGLGD